MDKLIDQLKLNQNCESLSENSNEFMDILNGFKNLSESENAIPFLNKVTELAEKAINDGNELHYSTELKLIDENELLDKYPREVLQYKNKIVLYLIYQARFKDCLIVAEKGTGEAIKTGHPDLAMLFLNNEGSCYWRMGKNDIALKRYLHSIDLSKEVEINENHFKPYCNAGLIFQSLGIMDQAYNYFLKAMDIAEKTNDDYARSAIYGNLGVFYYDMGDIEKSKDYYEKSIKLWEFQENKKGLSEIYNNISIYYSEKNQCEIARDYLKKSIDLAKSLNQTAQFINALESLSALEIQCGNKEKGETLAIEALELSTKNNFPFVTKQCYDNLAILNKENKEKALEYALKSLMISEEMKDKRLIKGSYSILRKIYEEHEDYKNALKYHKEMFAVNELIKNEEYSSKIAGLQSNYDFRESKKESEFLKNKNEELSQLISELERLNLEKSEFLGIAAHDLRNPLNAINGFSNILLDIIPKSTDAYGMIKDIKISADSMMDLINNLLDIHKIEDKSYGFNITRFNLIDFMEVLISRFKVNSQLKNQELKFYITNRNMVIQTDKNALFQIVENLISNAIKFSPDFSTVQISIGEKENKVECLIRDEGPGISDKDKGKVFKKYPHISNKPTSGERSTGLGLFIVKKLSEFINADVSFENNQTKGVTFKLSIPKKN